MDLLLEPDLPARLTLHPNDREVVVDLYLFDAATVTGSLRRSLIDTLLLLSHTGLRGRPFRLGLDNRDLVALSDRVPLAGLDAPALLDRLSYLARQAVRTRALLSRITFKGMAFTYGLAAPEASGA